MWTLEFWKQATERMVKSAGQGALLAVGADQLDALNADFVTYGGFALGAAFLSLCTSIASIGMGTDRHSPSAV